MRIAVVSRTWAEGRGRGLADRAEAADHRAVVRQYSQTERDEEDAYLRLGGESSAMPLGKKYAMALSPSESLMASAPSTAIG